MEFSSYDLDGARVDRHRTAEVVDLYICVRLATFAFTSMELFAKHDWIHQPVIEWIPFHSRTGRIL
jgi:hypothetical protein